ncbi:DMT family transporter [Oceanicoccus sagamiensis]|uniref:EamA family transporter n=1 Tax=Oceanicoccus sagamiensis TaxID=716816 RepID=A0A1X9NL24_9GAMM|nr:DMT family transporter [Oceanicoccus sagamiensis]ARN76119.1 EamA family transporter [Oceanicoccus sagamiensis]
MQSPEQNLVKGIALGVLTVFLGSSVSAVGKHLTDQVDIATIVLFQYLICFICTLPWLLRKGVSALKTDYLSHHIIRGVSGCLAFYAFYFALKYIPLVDASMLRNTAPLMVPMVLFIAFSIKIPKSRWLPLMIGFIGVAVMLQPGQSGASWWHLLGLASGLGLSLSMVYTRVLSQKESEGQILFYYFLISLVFVIPFFAFNYQPIPPAALPWLIYIGITMYFTFVLYTKAYKYVKPSILSPTSYFSVVFAGVFEWLIWGHIPSMITILGILLVVSGGLLVLRQNQST